MNPGGTGKDRAALFIIKRAEEEQRLPKSCDGGGGIVVEGTSGSTGISLAMLCNTRNHQLIVVLPDDQSPDKAALLRNHGAIVKIVSNCAISNPNHYVNVARKTAHELSGEQQQGHGRQTIFSDQFENEANFEAHYQTTGPEIWNQTQGQLDAFVMSSGTGGTISGVGRYLTEQNPDISIVLVDPPGSSLYNKVKYGVAYVSEQSERVLKRHRYDTLAEGIGLDRVTQNLTLGLGCISDAVRVQDQEAVDMAHWLLRNEGLFVGSSSAMNIVGAVRVASGLQPGKRVVTVACDNGERHLSRFWNRDFIVGERGLIWPGRDEHVDMKANHKVDEIEQQRIPECLKLFL